MFGHRSLPSTQLLAPRSGQEAGARGKCSARDGVHPCMDGSSPALPRLALGPGRRQDECMNIPAGHLPLPSCVINCVAYDREGHRHDITLDQISDVLSVDDGSFVWVGLYEPEDLLLDKLQEEFGLHDLAIEDAQHAHQ